jgi:hypothetical protein
MNRLKIEPAPMNNYDDIQLLNSNTRGVWESVWHLWTVVMPRRSITGRLLWGRVWRRHDGRRWIYKKFVEFNEQDR